MNHQVQTTHEHYTSDDAATAPAKTMSLQFLKDAAIGAAVGSGSVWFVIELWKLKVGL